MTRDHGGPYCHIHRVDYQAMLHRLARTAPDVRICLCAPVRAVQPDPSVPEGPSVTLTYGEVLYADLVVSADGVKSTLQKARGGAADPDGREPEPVGGPDEEPDPVWLRRVRGGRAVVDRQRT